MAGSRRPQRHLRQHGRRQSERDADHRPSGGHRGGERAAGRVRLNRDGECRICADHTARDASINAIAATGHGGTSTGSPVATNVETMVPLVAFAHFAPGHTPLAVNHSGLFVSATISFNLAPGASLGTATDEIDKAVADIGLPADIHGSTQGTAAVSNPRLPTSRC